MQVRRARLRHTFKMFGKPGLCEFQVLQKEASLGAQLPRAHAAFLCLFPLLWALLNPQAWVILSVLSGMTWPFLW